MGVIYLGPNGSTVEAVQQKNDAFSTVVVRPIICARPDQPHLKFPSQTHITVRHTLNMHGGPDAQSFWAPREKGSTIHWYI